MHTILTFRLGFVLCLKQSNIGKKKLHQGWNPIWSVWCVCVTYSANTSILGNTIDQLHSFSQILQYQYSDFYASLPPLVIFYEIKPQYSGHWYVQICVICNVIGVNDLRWCDSRDGSFSHCVTWNDGITVYSSGKCWNNLSEPRDKHGL